MKRLTVVGLGVAVVVAAVWGFVLGISEPEADSGTSRAGAAGAEGAGTDAEAKPAARAKAPATKRAPTAEENALALAGVVVGPGGAPVAGARVECLRVADGEPSDDVRAIREALGAAAPDPDDLDAILRQLGRDTSPSAADVRRSMGTGQRVFSRLATDPSAVARFGAVARDFVLGVERDAPLPALATTTADAQGAFRFDGLPKGTVEVRVAAPAHRRRKLRAAVGALDLRVELAAAGVVAGEVRCEGRPVEGAEVRFRTHVVRTGPDGRFRHDGAAAPREPVIASAPGCAARGQWVPVVLGAEPEPVVIDLDPAGRVTGRVTARDGSPVAGATVAFAPDASAWMQLFMPTIGGDAVAVAPPTAVTRADGTYAMEDVPARRVRLRAERDGFLAATAAAVRVPPRGTVEHVDFVLGRESLLEGRVTSAAGGAVAGAEVRVEVPGEGAARAMSMMMGGIRRAATTGADGAYRVGGLPEGARNVSVVADGWLRQKTTVTLPAEGSVRQDFVLRPGHRIAGTVVDPGGAAVPGATVRVAAKSDDGPANPFAQMLVDRPTAVTDVAGRFEVAGLQEGPYEVSAAAPAFLEGKVSGIPPGAEEVVVRLGAAAAIRGVVVAEADGAPIAGALVRRRPKGARPAANPFLDAASAAAPAMTDAAGVFQFVGVQPGAWELVATARGWADSAKTPVEATVGAAPEPVTIALAPGATLAGHVRRRADGAPVAGALVWVRTREGGMSFPSPSEILGEVPEAPPDAIHARSGEDGAFVLEGVTPGRVALEVRAAGFAPLTVTSTEAPSATAVVEMTAGGALEGTVYDVDGQPCEGQQVMLQQGMMGMGGRAATTDRRGQYRIERLSPGTFQAMLLDAESPMGVSGMSAVSIRDGETTRKDFGKRAPGGPVEGGVLADGAPVEGAAVMLLGSGSGGLQMAVSDARGRFRFDHVDAGSWSVMVQSSPMGGGSDSVKFVVPPDGSTTTVAIELSKLGVEGVVVDGETGRGVAMAHVLLLAAGRTSTGEEFLSRQKGQTFTDREGRFAISGVPKGTFSVRVTADGFAEQEVEGVAAGGQPVRVTMSRGQELTVTVLGPDERPVAGATVVPEDARGKEGVAFDLTMSRTTGADGVARLRLQPGSWVVHVRASGFPAARTAVDAGTAATTVRLDAGGAVEVVVRSGGAPVAGANVALLDAAGQPIVEAMTMSNFLGTGGTTDADGRARRDGIRPGKVTVVVRTPAGREVRTPATVEAGAVTRVEVAAE